MPIANSTVLVYRKVFFNLYQSHAGSPSYSEQIESSVTLAGPCARCAAAEGVFDGKRH